MEALVWAGAAVTLMGLAGLVLAILRAMRLRREALDDAAMRAALQRLVPLNLASLLLSILGLILVIVGLALS
jgi:hypothetical protein